MTRINVGIPVEKLTRQHLIAEHREIKRIPNAIRIGRFSMKDQPDTFTLGTGHVKFFYNKLAYLRKRYVNLHNECIKRGFNVTNYIDAWESIPEEYMGDYTPTQEAIELIEQRISERLNK